MTGTAQRRLLVAAALACVVVIVRLVTGGGELNYDLVFALTWGEDVLAERAPDFELALAPTAHPLTTCLAILLAPLSPQIGVLAMQWVAYLSLVAVLAIAGEPLLSLTHTRESASSLRRVTGLGEVPGQLRLNLDRMLGPAVLAGAAAGAACALLRRRGLAALRVPIATGVLLGIAFAALGAADASLLARYLLVPGALRAVLSPSRCVAGATSAPRARVRRGCWAPPRSRSPPWRSPPARSTFPPISCARSASSGRSSMTSMHSSTGRPPAPPTPAAGRSPSPTASPVRSSRCGSSARSAKSPWWWAGAGRRGRSWRPPPRTASAS